MKRFKMNLDINLSKLDLPDNELNELVRTVADNISEQVRGIGPGRIDYEVVEVNE